MKNLNHVLPYRLALDINTSAVGLVCYQLDKDNNPCDVMHIDATVFREPIGDDKSGKLKKALRREKRGMRRQTGRRAQRLRKISHLFHLAGVSSKDVQEVQGDDVHRYRSEAITQKITAAQLMAVLLLITKNRGYNGRFVNEDGKVKARVDELRETLKQENCKTVGQLLYKRKLSSNKGIFIKSWKKISQGDDSDPNNKISHGTYADRELLQQEINAIFDEQKKHHDFLERACPDDIIKNYFNKENVKTILTDSVKTIRDAFYHAVFDQRPLWWDKESIGSCALEPEEPRIARAHPIFQQFRIEELLCNLEWKKMRAQLTTEQKNVVRTLLNQKKEVTAKTVYKKLDISDDIFTHDRERQTGHEYKLIGNVSETVFKKLEKECDMTLTSDEKNLFIELIADVNDPSFFAVDGWKDREDITSYFAGYTQEHKQHVIKFITQLLDHKDAHGNHKPMLNTLSNMGFESNRASYSKKALNLIIPIVQQGKGSDKAVRELYPNKPQQENNLFSIGDSVVQQSLHETQKAVEYVLHKFGKPTQVVVELSREMKLSQEKRKTIEKMNKSNEKAREQAKSEIEGLHEIATTDNIKRYLLWIEQNKQCPYCGQPISCADVFNGNKTDVDHVIPRSKGGDNSHANLVLAHKSCNQNKGDRLPLEAFTGKNGDVIRGVSNAMTKPDYLVGPYIAYKNTVKIKAKRLVQEVGSETDADDDFRLRQNAETSWIGKEMLSWLKKECNDERGDMVYVSRGMLTAYLRKQLALETVIPDVRTKEGKVVLNRAGDIMETGTWRDHLQPQERQYDKRSDHRHHIIDAAVIGLVDRSLFKKATNYYKNHNGIAGFNSELHGRIPQNLRTVLCEKLFNYVVWHKPDRHPNGKFFNDTLRKKESNADKSKLIVRKRLEELLGKQKEETEKNLETIVADKIKAHIKTEFSRRYDLYVGTDEKVRIKFALCGEHADDGIVFPEHTKNKVKNVKCYQKEGRGLSQFDEDVDKTKIMRDKRGQHHTHYAANEEYACVEIVNNMFRFVPLWQYHTKQYQAQLKGNADVRIYKNDILFDADDEKFFLVMKFNKKAAGICCIQSSESQNFDEFNKKLTGNTKKKIHLKTITKTNIKNITLVKNRKQLADIISTQRQAHESKSNNQH